MLWNAARRRSPHWNILVQAVYEPVLNPLKVSIVADKKLLLEITDLQVYFNIKDNTQWFWQPAKTLKAVDGMTLNLYQGETLGIVGESGCGKSTLARAIIGLVKTSGGSVTWLGKNLPSMTATEWRTVRRDIQMIFQDPVASLNPRMTIGEIIAEPLRTYHPQMSRQKMQDNVKAMMLKVGLLSNLINRYPHEFSGGQCQRIGIARALILQPKLVICDEPVSALDVSIQAQVVNLLQKLQQDMGLSLIFISHDLSVVKHISDRVLVMYLGHTVELGSCDQIYHNPQHPYTKALMSAMLIPDPDKERAKKTQLLAGELPSPIDPPSGCVFHTRCPIATAECVKTRPTLAGNFRHAVACLKVKID
ncbi:oligopeptide ABC transporter ATP-binding protein OppF [Candidatus Fukatsuia symbiotica]|uniref:Oligopeptide ABC transporter ATP-binding protein OppF n=1 Tax=Candidatus Fukatsuia symbiotica TaxID=1878942 RepID=A0A2U8I2M4_9GAMM|nr:oligopeptide ABC transporter ATP-binding protein OppF [Candidatus Fukatsuia symbiotica]